MSQSQSSFLGLVVKGVLAGIVYVVGVMLTGMLFAALHIRIVSLDLGGNPRMGFLLFVLVTPLLGLALVPLARHTAGSRLYRGVALFFLLFISLGVNTILEMRVFLTIYAHGGALAAIFLVLPPALLTGLALSFLLTQEQPEIPASEKIRAFFAARSPLSWAMRSVLAILAFAVAYFVFGSIIAPFVVPFYRAHVLALTLPPVSAILPVLFVRSALFLLACLPFLILWTRSRVSLIFSLGLAHWFLNGLMGMLMVFVWPPVMRIAHGLETGADSFVYAAALVLLLMPRQREHPVTTAAHAAPVFPS